MNLNSLVIVLLRIYSLKFFGMGLLYIFSYASGQGTAFIWIGLFHFILGCLIWFIAPFITKLITNKLEKEISIETLNLIDCYTLACVVIGLYYVVGYMGQSINCIINLFQVTTATCQGPLQKSFAFHTIYTSVIPFICGVVLILKGRYLSNKLAKFHQQTSKDDFTNEKYKVIACKVMWRELCYFASKSPNSFDFQFLPYGLHGEPKELHKEVQKAIDKTENDYDAILLGYGLCSNGLDNIIARDIKLVIAKGHDCITHFLGSKEKYKDYFDANPGTYWYSPGWIENHIPPSKERYEKNYEDYLDKYGEDNAQYLMEIEQNWFNEYSTAAYVDIGVGNTSEYEKYTKECAKYLKWKYDRLEGDPSLIKNFVNGIWDNDTFVIVEPGYRIKATNDENILKTVKHTVNTP